MRARTVALLCLAALLLSGCGEGTLSSPALNVKGQKDAATSAACRANLKLMYTAEQSYSAENGSFASREQLEQFYGKLPDEPNGGTYSIDAQSGRVTCSLGHGSEPR